jgi:4-amino-4-deoxy-L-arabinose transferase-like glycosyltransferase
LSTTVETPTVEPPSATERLVGRPRRVAVALRDRLGVEHLALSGILALAAALNTVRLARNGYANIYYSAAVKSMLHSLHNFLFVSFDPGGFMTVDKPPLGLWLQALSAKLFGFAPLSLMLPEAILGVLAVAAMYAIVARRFGAVAGLASALALAVFPSFVAVSRDNNLDTMLITLMLLGCGAALRATETGRLRWLVCAAALVGLAFNTKSLGAYLVVPGMAVAYLICAPSSWRRRAAHLVVAGVVLFVVSFGWIEYVDLTPSSQRPYVGGSTNNNEVNLAFNYNGFGRVGGQVGGPGRVPVVAANVGPRSPTPARSRRHLKRPLVTFGGPAGPLRLLDSQLGGQGGWLLPFALVGAVAIGLTVRRRRDPRLAGLIVLGGWFAAEALLLSFGKGIIHPYYVSALAPGTAALVGAGLAAFAAPPLRSSWRRIVAVAAIVAAAAAQYVLLHREHYLTWYLPILFGGATLCACLVMLLPRFTLHSMAAALAVLLVAPAAYASTTWSVPVEGTFPAAGPRMPGGAGGLGVNRAAVKANVALIDYVRRHSPTPRWWILTDASTTAAPMILLGAPAGSLGGYSGTDPALDGPGLARLVARHEARYVLLGGAYWSRGGNRATVAVERACRGIPQASVRGALDQAAAGTVAAAGGTLAAPAAPPAATVAPSGATGPSSLAVLGAHSGRRQLESQSATVLPPRPNTLTLYDCAGRAAALARA